MLTYPDINPVALQLGPLAIHWYGVMYLIGFIGAFGYCYHYRLKGRKPWHTEEIIDLVFYLAVGVIFGGTLGYLLFYEPCLLLQDPLRMLRFWERGRSFHGGLLGVIIALLIFCHVRRRRFWDVADFIAPAVPIGIATGRLGNFINGELWGRVTNMPWGMVFRDAGNIPRHPSQLYEFGLEGVGLFLLLHWYAKIPRRSGAIAGLFLLGYGCVRFVAEFFRAPDPGLGFLAWGWVTMGQLLSGCMMVAGLFIVSTRR